MFGFLRSVADFFLHAEILKLYILKKTLSFRDNTKRGSWGERTKRSSSASPCQLSWDLAILLILCFILTYSYDKTFLESVRQNNAEPQIAINIILAALCPVKLTIFSLLDFLWSMVNNPWHYFLTTALLFDSWYPVPPWFLNWNFSSKGYMWPPHCQIQAFC